MFLIELICNENTAKRYKYSLFCFLLTFKDKNTYVIIQNNLILKINISAFFGNSKCRFQ